LTAHTGSVLRYLEERGGATIVQNGFVVRRNVATYKVICCFFLSQAKGLLPKNHRLKTRVYLGGVLGGGIGGGQFLRLVTS
jgi:hypothetical protein